MKSDARTAIEVRRRDQEGLVIEIWCGDVGLVETVGEGRRWRGEEMEDALRLKINARGGHTKELHMHFLRNHDDKENKCIGHPTEGVMNV